MAEGIEEKLRSFGLYYNQPEPAIICISCGFALKTNTDRVSRHLGEAHEIARKARRGLNRLVQSLNLPDPGKLPPRPDGSEIHPHLALQNGAACKHCRFRSVSRKVLSQHLRLEHKDKIKQHSSARGGSWLQDHVLEQLQFQSWLAGDILHSWQVKASPQSGQLTVPSGTIAPAEEVSVLVRQRVEELYARELQYLSTDAKHTAAAAAAAADDNSDASAATAALMSTWMRRTGWAGLIREARRDLLVALSALPSSRLGPLQLVEHDGRALVSCREDEDRFSLMVAAVDRLFDRCCDTVRHTDVPIRRWLRGRFADRPFKAPFELVARPESERKYRQLMKRCLCFWLRLWRLPQKISHTLTRRSLSGEQKRILGSLWRDPIWEKPLPKASSDLKSSGSNVGAQAGLDNYREASAFRGNPPKERGDVDEEGASETGSTLSWYSSDDEYGTEEEEEEECEDDNDDDNDDYEDEDIIKSTCGNEKMGDRGADDPAADAILRFLYLLATEDFTDGQSSSTMLVYFSAVCGLSPPAGANFLRPAQYTTHLSGLIYCTRLILFEAVLPRMAHSYVGIPARPHKGQLAILQSLRQEKMCDGCLSPLGEFLSLLAFGQALRQSEVPAFMFEWSEDGEEICWDGDQRLTMTAFRGLVWGVLQAAIRISCRLMYKWKPPAPNFKNIHDRLSNSIAGYSFANDSRNELSGLYLELFNRACLAPIDGLIQAQGRGEGSWDLKVARFLPEPVALIVFNYLVFIRPLTYMLLRTCFQKKVDKGLLFAPASSSSSWKPAVLSNTLLHFSKGSQGVPAGLGAQLYRQVSIAITERHLQAASRQFNRYDEMAVGSKPDAVFAWQSGHRPRQRFITYGLDGAYPHQLQPALLQLYMHASEQWHTFLRLGEQQNTAYEKYASSSAEDHAASKRPLDSGPLPSTSASPRPAKRLCDRPPLTASPTLQRNNGHDTGSVCGSQGDAAITTSAAEHAETQAGDGDGGPPEADCLALEDAEASSDVRSVSKASHLVQHAAGGGRDPGPDGNAEIPVPTAYDKADPVYSGADGGWSTGYKTTAARHMAGSTIGRKAGM
ncbi:hypothetical protein TGAM01_v211085 [Trichoderma gamsii]|uniref:Uncharacterized protein n=1 Tax=Trichoderma gamsii TaxID=398673 RepID=A0A2P4Z6X9_9HYPO|nr:hypothetical protein TGAM01_v211085 [Trichoderma gamsii]PON20041.1 hypothetical protein TGAM01_v211085 [Trichoderma gamsii]